MCATAELDRVADLEHPDDVAVLVAEESNGTESRGLFLRRLERARRRVGQRLTVGDALDLSDLGIGHGVVVAEVEPKPIRRYERAGLLDMFSEDLSQRVVQHMRTCVVATDRGTAGNVDRCRDLSARRQGSLGDASGVSPQTGQRKGRVDDLRRAPVCRLDRAGVADLAAAFGIERGAVEEQFDCVIVIRHHGQQAGIRRIIRVAEELGDPELLDDLSVDVDAVVVGGVALARRFGTLTLSFHLGLEAGRVDRDVALAGDLFGQFEWETVCVVQKERGRTG